MARRTGRCPRADADIALHRQQLELEREDEDQHVADHEDRHREAGDRDDHHQPVDPAARRATRRARRAARRASTASTMVTSVSATVGSIRWAIISATGRLVKIEMPRSPCEDVPQPTMPKRAARTAIEPELRADALDVGVRRLIAGDDRRGIAGRQIEQREDEQRDERHHRDRREMAADDVANKALLPRQGEAGEGWGRWRRTPSPPLPLPVKGRGCHVFSMFQRKGTGAMITPRRLRGRRSGGRTAPSGRRARSRTHALDFLRDLFLVGRCRRHEPRVAQLLELRHRRPAEPPLLAVAAQPRVDRRRRDVGADVPGVEDAPAALSIGSATAARDQRAPVGRR